jgi:hypothetical protein
MLLLHVEARRRRLDFVREVPECLVQLRPRVRAAVAELELSLSVDGRREMESNLQRR